LSTSGYALQAGGQVDHRTDSQDFTSAGTAAGAEIDLPGANPKTDLQAVLAGGSENFQPGLDGSERIILVEMGQAEDNL
jgi:hypothetical protein